MKLLQSQPDDIKEVSKKSVQTNAFFSHSSNLLAAMLCYEDESIRRKAVNTIINIRSGETESEVERTNTGLRIFKVPNLNWDARNYT